MRIEQLAAAFKQAVSGIKVAAKQEILPPEPETPERLSPTPKPKLPTREQDSVVVSDEAVFRFAASRFDPHRITPGDARALFDVLRDGDAISSRDHAILNDGVSARANAFDDPAQVPRNIVADFQDTLARQLGGSKIIGVERTARALSILGRLEGARSEGMAAVRIR
jgi:hypothetical protein